MTNIDSNTRPGLDFSPYVTAIIPAYNEADSISSVLATLAGVNLLTEIIVVDDGSRDGTHASAARAAQDDPRIGIIQHERNQGKGAAVYNAWQSTGSPYLLTLDADLVGLSQDHVDALLKPVVTRRSDMTLGLFRKGAIWTDLGHRLTPWLTGQRCFRSGLLHFTPRKALEGYGLETALTLAARDLNWRVENVILPRVSHPPSEFHRGPWVGFQTRIRMYAQIIRAYLFMRRAQRWKKIVARLKDFSIQG